MNQFFKKNSAVGTPNSGQTLIETLVAVFILTMGITAAVGLSVFALASSSSVTKQIIATGLAREGIEAVRNMRDTNWLQQTTMDDCYDFASSPVGQNTAKCYQSWLGDDNLSIAPYCLNPTNNNGNCNGGAATQDYYLGINPSAPGTSFWNLARQLNSSNFGLNFDPVGTNGYYAPSNSLNGNSEYYRKIIISVADNSSAAFNTNVGPKMQVSVQVWWTDKKCPRSATWPGLGKCSVQLDTYLTNWKNYK